MHFYNGIDVFGTGWPRAQFTPDVLHSSGLAKPGARPSREKKGWGGEGGGPPPSSDAKNQCKKNGDQFLHSLLQLGFCGRSCLLVTSSSIRPTLLLLIQQLLCLGIFLEGFPDDVLRGVATTAALAS